MKTLDTHLRQTATYLRAQWRYIGASVIVVAFAALLSFSFAPRTVVSLPFNYLLVLFVVVGSAVMLPVVLILQMRSSRVGVEKFVDELTQEVEVLKEKPEKRAVLIALNQARAIVLRENRELTAYEADKITKLIEERQELKEKEQPWTYVRGLTPHTDLRVNSETGHIFHGTMRHVLFRIGTIQEILLALASEELKPVNPDKRLFDTGFRMGTGFGHDFTKHLQEQGLSSNGVKNDAGLDNEPDLDDMIEKWCDFDVSGGWGKWHPTRQDENDVGYIEIKNNFLTVHSTPDVLKSKSLCKLLEGYITGVLQVLARAAKPDPRWEAKVEELECSIDYPKVKRCKFRFKLYRSDMSTGKEY